MSFTTFYTVCHPITVSPDTFNVPYFKSYPNSIQFIELSTKNLHTDDVSYNILVTEYARITIMHYCDAIMGAMASHITSLTIVYSTVYSCADQRKHQSPASLAFVRGNSPVTGEFPAQMASKWKMFPFDDVIMGCSCYSLLGDYRDLFNKVYMRS